MTNTNPFRPDLPCDEKHAKATTLLIQIESIRPDLKGAMHDFLEIWLRSEHALSQMRGYMVRLERCNATVTEHIALLERSNSQVINSVAGLIGKN